jgi:hypothetical protein
MTSLQTTSPRRPFSSQARARSRLAWPRCCCGRPTSPTQPLPTVPGPHSCMTHDISFFAAPPLSYTTLLRPPCFAPTALPPCSLNQLLAHHQKHSDAHTPLIPGAGGTSHSQLAYVTRRSWSPNAPQPSSCLTRPQTSLATTCCRCAAAAAACAHVNPHP